MEVYHGGNMMNDETNNVNEPTTTAELSWDARLKSLSIELGVSERTVQRRLGRQGTGFRQQRDERRRQRAQQLLRESQKSIAEIAEDLGFANTTSFSRAFRRWFNLTPGDFRGGEPA